MEAEFNPQLVIYGTGAIIENGVEIRKITLSSVKIEDLDADHSEASQAGPDKTER